MRAPPRLRGGPAARLSALVAGLFLFACGIALMLASKLGLAPWDVFHQGLAKQTPLTFGSANIVVSVSVVVLAWSLGARVGPGMFANALLVGGFLQLLISVGAVSAAAGGPLGARIGEMAAGVALMGLGTGLYLGANFGPGPRDALMLVGSARTGLRFGVVRAAIELTVLLVGWLLGGTVGIGTVAFALAIGVSVEAAFWLLERTPLVLPVLSDLLGSEERRELLEGLVEP